MKIRYTLYNRYLLVPVLLLVSFVFRVHAQTTYSVQINTHLLPPYSLYLSDYYSGTRDKVTVTLINRDQFKPTLNVRLRMTITAPGGVRMQTNDNAPIAPIVVETGAPLRLTQEDLAPYFRTENLIAQGFLTEGKLPEGMVQFCFQAVEAYTGHVLSAPTCAQAYITSQKPPLLSLPMNNENIVYREPLNILFQWTPLHQGLALVEYEFILKELWDNGMAVQAAFAYSPEIYRETTRSTSLPYGAVQPVLLPGKRYAWCVRAQARDGLEELNVFQNNGYTEVRTFTLQDNCAPPALVNAVVERKTLRMDWPSLPEHIGFTVSYRLKSTDGKVNPWQDVQTLEPAATLYNLQSGGVYEYRVGSYCIAGQPVYTPILEATVPKTDSARMAQCGIMAAVNLTNQEPLKELKTNEVIMASDFPVTITRVSGSNGTFTGEGWIIVPWLNDAKVAVTFDNITVNTDRQMTAGYIDAKYDKNESQIADLDAITEGGDETGTVKTGITRTDFTFDFSIPGVESFSLNDEGNLVITDDDGGEHVVVQKDNEGQGNVGNSIVVFPMTVKDKDGKMYQVDKATETDPATGQTKEVAKATYIGQVRAPLADGSFDRDQLDGDKAIVTFKKGKGRYAFDTWKDYYGNVALIRDEYGDELYTGYRAAWKFLPENGSDVVQAQIVIKDTKTIDPDKVIFITPKGTEYKATRVDDVYTLTVSSGPVGDGQEVYALYAKTSSTYYTLGKLVVATYKPQSQNVVLVSVNDAPVDEQAIRDTLQSVYGSVGVTWSIQKQDFDYTSSDQLMAESTGLSTYNDAMSALNAAYKAAHTGDFDASANYLFFLKATGADEPNVRDYTGFMPRGAQFGYIFTSEITRKDIPKTVAHELGHGRWKLYHTFDDHYGGYNKGKTDNLMDYGTGDLVAKWQWDILSNPAMLVSIFQGDDASASQIVSQLEHKFRNKDNTTFTFITYAGEYITLPSNVTRLIFNFGINRLEGTMDLVTGVLQSFQVDNKVYTASFNGGVKYMSGTEVYQNPVVPDNLEASVIMALPCENALTVYRFSAIGLKRYNHIAPSPPLSEADFPVVPFRDDFGVVQGTSGPVTQQLPEQPYDYCQWCFTTITADIVEDYCGEAEILYVSKIAQLRNAYQGLFDTGFTSGGSHWEKPLPQVSVETHEETPTGRWGWVLKNDKTGLLGLYDDESKRYLFFKEMLASLKEYIVSRRAEIKDFFANLPADANAEVVRINLEGLSDDDILQFDIPTRIRILTILSKRQVTEDKEDQIVRVIRDVKESDQGALVLAMDTASLYMKLEDHMNNFGGKANYTAYADLMIKYSFKVPNTEDPDEQERLFNYVNNPNGTYTRFSPHFGEHTIKFSYETHLITYRDPDTGKIYTQGLVEDLPDAYNGLMELGPNKRIHLYLMDDFSMAGVAVLKKSDYPKGISLTALQFATLLARRIHDAEGKFTATSLIIPFIPVVVGPLGTSTGWELFFAILDAQAVLSPVFVNSDAYNALYTNNLGARSYLNAWQKFNQYYCIARITHAAGKVIADQLGILKAEATAVKNDPSISSKVKEDLQINKIEAAARVLTQNAAEAPARLAAHPDLQFMSRLMREDLGVTTVAPKFESALARCDDNVMAILEREPQRMFRAGNVGPLSEADIVKNLTEVAVTEKTIGQLRGANVVRGVERAELLSDIRINDDIQGLENGYKRLGDDATKQDFLDKFEHANVNELRRLAANDGALVDIWKKYPEITDLDLLEAIKDSPGVYAKIQAGVGKPAFDLLTNAEKAQLLKDYVGASDAVATRIAADADFAEAWKILNDANEGVMRREVAEVERIASELPNIKQAGGYRAWKNAIINANDFNNLQAAPSNAISGGKRSIGNVKNLVNEGQAIVISPPPGSALAQKVDDYMEAYTSGAGGGNLQGSIGEDIAEMLAKQLDNSTVLNIKNNGSGHGFDILQFENGIENPTVIRIIESKPLGGTTVELPSTLDGTQMSTKWKRAKIDEMLYSSNEATRDLGKVLYENYDRIEGYLFTIDKDFKQVIIMKLDTF